eukprot:1200444-Rhodomonas_salina.3
MEYLDQKPGTAVLLQVLASKHRTETRVCCTSRNRMNRMVISCSMCKMILMAVGAELYLAIKIVLPRGNV